jgi:hypothetical protein
METRWTPPATLAARLRVVGIGLAVGLTRRGIAAAARMRIPRAGWNPWIRFHLDYIDGRVRAQESGLHAGPMKKF